MNANLETFTQSTELDNVTLDVVHSTCLARLGMPAMFEIVEITDHPTTEDLPVSQAA